ncbi:hypothetical protein GGF43_003658, partial [Coemansia sp. RSA 2618]
MDVGETVLLISSARHAVSRAAVYVCSLLGLVYMAGMQRHFLADAVAGLMTTSPVYHGGKDILIGASALSLAWPLRTARLRSKTARKAMATGATHARAAWTTFTQYYQGSLDHLWRQITFTQERQLIQIQQQDGLTLDEIPELPEAQKLQTICGDFLYNVDEPLFLLRAIYRAVWPSLIPLYAADMIIQGIDMARILLDGFVMHCLDAPAEHAWYSGYAAALLLLLLRIVKTKTQDISNYSTSGWARMTVALEHEFLRLPLAKGGLRRIGSTYTETEHVSTLLNGMRGVHTVVVRACVVAVSAWTISRQVGWLALVPFAVHMASSVLRTVCAWQLGSDYDWKDDGGGMCDPQIDDIVDTIRTVKMFGWERKYLDQKPQPRRFRTALPWYAPAVRMLWFTVESIEMIVSHISAGVITYAFAHSTNGDRRILTAQVFQINDLADNMRCDIESIIPQLRGLHVLVKRYFMVERFLRGDFVPTLPHDKRGEVNAQGPSVSMHSCTFTRNRKRTTHVLEDVSIDASGGSLIAVVGKTGSGKSSLLMAIAGELEMLSGTGHVKGEIGYLGQTPWIINDTMRANVLFGRLFDETYYWRVLRACALDADLATWPDSDLTVIGDRGINISGGQRARLALARALYSRADVYLLDDPLSAVDAHVKRHIMEHVILDSGLLAGKLRIISTHTRQIIPFSHQIVSLCDGKATVERQVPQTYRPAPSTSKDVAAEKPELSSDKKESDKEDSDSDDEDSDDEELQKWPLRDNLAFMLRLCGVPLVAGVVVAGLTDPILSFVMDGHVLSALQADKTSVGGGVQGTLHYLFLSMASDVVQRLISRVRNAMRRNLIDTHMDARIKRVFVRSVVHAPLAFFDSVTQHHVSDAYYRGVNKLSSLVVTLLMYDVGACVRVVLSLYRMCGTTPQLLCVVPVALWLEAKRNNLVDGMFDSIWDIERAMSVRHKAVSAIVASSKQMIRLFGVDAFFMQSYMAQHDEEMRVEAVRHGLSSLSRTLHMALTSSSDMLLTCMLLLQFHVGHTSISAGEYLHYTTMANTLIQDIEQLMGFPSKLRELSASVDVFRRYASMPSESEPKPKPKPESELESLSESESESTSALESELKPEPEPESITPPEAWPDSGEIVFRDFTMRYRADLTPALRCINLTVRPGEKIGIVGRTGAGKSTLAKSLFRLNEGHLSGSITIDGVDIQKLDVKCMRPRIGIIPQESTLFAGTLRENLDPLGQFTIEDMWAAMIDCNVAPMFASNDDDSDSDSDSGSDSNSEHEGDDDDDDDGYDSDGRVIENRYNVKHQRRVWKRAGYSKRVMLYMLDEMPPVKSWRVPLYPHKLDRSVRSSTGTLSNGQQQMFSLCRLLMRRRKVIVLDEATADVDLETDRDIHELIHAKFSDCTILTIAHRLETVMKSDRIV